MLDLKELSTMIELIQKVHNIEGWLSDSEAILLYLMAKNGPGDGAIVEIGSFKGRSTIYLAQGSIDGNREIVTSIDPHQGSRTIMNCVPPGGTEATFKENLRKFNVFEHVDAYTATSEKIAKTWDKKIRLLFIDGNHDYEAVKLDYELWEPHLIVGGLIAMHDSSGGFPGPKAVVNQYIKHSEKFADLVLIDSLTIARKVK